eukprot:jgi/Antlo1/2114/2311
MRMRTANTSRRVHAIQVDERSIPSVSASGNAYFREGHITNRASIQRQRPKSVNVNNVGLRTDILPAASGDV